MQGEKAGPQPNLSDIPYGSITRLRLKITMEYQLIPIATRGMSQPAELSPEQLDPPAATMAPGLRGS